MTVDKFIEKLKLLFRAIEIEELDMEYHIKLNDKMFELSKLRIEELIQKYNNLNGKDETTIYSSNYYETLIEQDRPIVRGDIYSLKDDYNKIYYEIGTISDEYIIFILDKFVNEENFRFTGRMLTMRTQAFLMKINDSDEFIDIIRMYLRRFTTIRIKSNSNFTGSKFKELTDALLFNITLNTGKSIIPIKHFEDVFGQRMSINSNHDIQQVEAPQRKYISDLVYYYQMGISTLDPSQKFISFYHVIEYFFNKVYYESLVESVRDSITNPKFSPKRDADINKLIKNIKKKIKTESEVNDIRNEKEALKLTLKKYIEIDKLKTEIISENLTSIDYYINKTVPFSKGDKINFQESNVDNIFSSMTNRIYKTRNAVIHSKLDEESRYIPFKHESQLHKEIPLIKLIAEEIIISTSEIL